MANSSIYRPEQADSHRASRRILGEWPTKGKSDPLRLDQFTYLGHQIAVDGDDHIDVTHVDPSQN